jgi:hypothetical protein
VRHHTAACRARIYIDPAMPEPIACALVGDLVLSLSPGRFVLVHSVRLHFRRSWRMVVAWCCNRHHEKRPDSEFRTANSVRALLFVCALLSLVASLYSGYNLLHGRHIFASSLSLVGSSASHTVIGHQLRSFGKPALISPFTKTGVHDPTDDPEEESWT